MISLFPLKVKVKFKYIFFNWTMQCRNAIQHDVLHEWRAEVGVVTPKPAHVAHVLEWARVEALVWS
jgi:hypothetical protein